QIENAPATIYMQPGETRSFTAIIAHPTFSRAGIDIAVKDSHNENIGTLTAGTGLKVLSSEVVQSSILNMSNGEIRCNFSWTAPNSEGTFSLEGSAAAVNNDFWTTGDAWTIMNAIPVVVSNPHVTLTNPNGSEVICRGGNLLIAWNSIFVPGNINIELSSNGVDWQTIGSSIPAANYFYNWTVLPNQLSSSTYKVRISDATNSQIRDTSDANFSILSTPIITTHPKTDSACVGSPITFSVTADNQPYTYQWRRNGNNITGATTSSYSIAAAQQADVGSYDVVVTGCVPLISNPASFTLIAPPSITSQSNDTAVCKGSSVTLSCNVLGANVYQWKRNGNVVTGVFTPTLVIPSVTAADTGTYILMVNGKCPPPQISNPISLRFINAPSITAQPRDTTVCFGASAKFSVENTGKGTTYQWRKNSKNIDNAVGSNLIISSVTASEVGGYDVVITNSCNLSTTSSVVQLKTRDAVVIVSNPRDTTIQANLNVTLSVSATGTGIKYQWQKNNINRNGDTLATLTIAGLKLSDSGNYKCIVKNECGSSESSIAKLKVTSPPAGPALALSISSIDFGCNKVGVANDTLLSNVVFNGGGQTLNISNIAITGGADASDFSIVSGGGAFTLAPNEKHSIKIRFTSSSRTAKKAFLEFTSNTSTTAPKIGLEGKGCAGTITTFTANAGTSDVGKAHDTTIKICNTGDFDLVVSSVQIKDVPSDFSVVSPGTTILKPNDCLSITVTFLPTAVGNRTAELLVKTDEGDFTIQMEGTGIPATGVNESDRKDIGVSVYPNPSSGNVKFAGSVASPMPVNVRIFDAMGNSVYQTTIGVTNAGEFSFAWNASSSSISASSGHYMALFTIGAKTITVPFLIIR
ncbi:MAG: immunoglobulin domain-containing protein, partial [Ignavibacteriae bacterium]|nr:immunoglobulin domain-containing protein [Ignavibacteriota bacterium]